MKTFLCFLLLLAARPVFAQEGGWRDQQGNSAPDTDARKSKDGFAGWVLITSDADWAQKWNTPAETTPHFAEAKKVARGKPLFVLIFFANPARDDGNVANVTGDIDLLKPDGASAVHQADAECFKGVLKGNPHNTFLSAAVMKFVGDPDDPVGEWTARVTLKDNQRHVTLALKASFVLER